LNGSGTAGISNLPPDHQERLYCGVIEAGREIAGEAPLVMFPFRPSIGPSPKYERALLAQALATGLAATRGRSRIHWVGGGDARSIPAGPVVALGQLRGLVHTDAAGPRVGERQELATFNDLFALHLRARLGTAEGPPAINPFFAITASKAETYRAFESFVAADDPLLARTPHDVAADAESLLVAVRARVTAGHGAVVKPLACGGGRGVAFFQPGTSEADLRAALARSQAEVVWPVPIVGEPPRPAFPYAVCDLLEADTVPRFTHPLFGHRFEIRILIYRHDGRIRGFPSIAKVAPRRFSAAAPEAAMLLNNISHHGEGAEGHALPLASPATLDALGLDVATLENLTRRAVAFVDHVARLPSPG
ncbi:MAG TPA: hypothetical protein DCQ33_01460, partial [Nitrospira sp.]|nr:hypothetical protein [Nitrospira sp.]